LVSFHEFSLKEFHRFLNCILFADLEFHEDYSARPQRGVEMPQEILGCTRTTMASLRGLGWWLSRTFTPWPSSFKRYFADALKEMCNVRGKGGGV
jgi:hypothetical protein